MGKFIDLTGQRFGRLVVLRRAANHGVRVTWECRCDCGNTCEVTSDRLRRGVTHSCGCYHRECVAKMAKTIGIKHGYYGTRLYTTWQSMKQRCYYKGSKNYKNYGARGITICEEWKNSFDNFRKWAFSNGYSDTLTIERKDVNGNYCPENCMWIPPEAQSRNRRGQLKYKGKTISQWAHELGLKRVTVYARCHRYNWDIEEAIGLKPRSIDK